MKSARRVNDDYVLAATDSRIDSVESDGRWIGARSPAHEVGARALRPCPKLVVLPDPFTPTTRTTVGAVVARMTRGSLLPERSEVSIAVSSASRN